MAAGKQTPRQKMIAMMYLVLTAILALNVSKEVLDAFVTVNNGLENTARSFDKDIAQLYSKFDEKKSIDPMRVQAMWIKAQEAKKMSAEIGIYIEGMKKMLIRETEGYKNKEEDTVRLEFVENKEQYDIPTNILCGASEDGSDGQARVLRKKLDTYREAMLNLLPPAEKAAMHLSIESKDPTDGGELRTWEMKTFYHTPLAADITILSKIQDDVKAAEADVVEALLRQTDSDIIPFDTVAARVIASTNYVMMGDTFKSEIFLAAFNKTLAPQILLGKFNPKTGKMEGAYDSVNVSNGMGKYFASATREGIFTYEGVINMTTPKGKVMQYPFKSEYIVARPALAVSAEKMNVMYAGLENPIMVSVPGVPIEKTHVSCDNGTMTSLGNGRYMITNPQAEKKFCHITVTADMENGEKKNMGSMEFRVKYLPKPYGSLSGVDGPKVTAAKLGSLAGIACSYGPDFEFKANPKITSFTYEYSVNGVFSAPVPVRGNLFDANMQGKFRSMKKGTRVIFDNIVAIGPDNRAVTLPAISLTIN
jgi:gliding motility-associated protein GldM